MDEPVCSSFQFYKKAAFVPLLLIRRLVIFRAGEISEFPRTGCLGFFYGAQFEPASKCFSTKYCYQQVKWRHAVDMPGITTEDTGSVQGALTQNLCLSKH